MRREARRSERGQYRLARNLAGKPRGLQALGQVVLIALALGTITILLAGSADPSRKNVISRMDLFGAVVLAPILENIIITWIAGFAAFAGASLNRQAMIVGVLSGVAHLYMSWINAVFGALFFLRNDAYLRSAARRKGG